MAKLSNETLVYTSAFGARDPISTGAGKTPPFHWGSDFGPTVRNKRGVRLNAVIAGSVTHLKDVHGAIGARVMAYADAALAALLQRLYGRGRVGSAVRVSIWHLAEGGLLVPHGAQVAEGQAIGIMGSTGLSTGVHVHVELSIDGVRVDPKPFLDAQASKAIADAPADYYGEGFLMALTGDEQREALDLLREIALYGKATRGEQLYKEGDVERSKTDRLQRTLDGLVQSFGPRDALLGKMHDAHGRIETTIARTDLRTRDLGWLMGKTWDKVSGQPAGTTVAISPENRAQLAESIAALLERDHDAVREVGEALLRQANGDAP